MTVGPLANDAIFGGGGGTWETILNNADVGSSEAAVDIFEGVAVISPRGLYTVELHLSFLRLRGQANDIFIIKYSSIVRLFILPKVNSAWQGVGPNDLMTFVVVTLDPPVRKGKTLYPHIVIQFPTEVMVETDLNLSSDLLDGKYKDRLEESYMGPMHEVFTEVLGGLSGAKVSTPGSFRTCLDGYAVKTSLKSEHGLLYPHEKGFFFLPNPPMIIPYEEIEFVGFGRYCREGARKSSCYFDVLVKRKNGQEHIFRNIERNEYRNLFSFFNGKHLKTVHLGDGQAGDEQSDEEDEKNDLHMDGGSSIDDSSGDESESSESEGEKEKSFKKEASSSKPPAKRERPKVMDDEGSEKRKWKKKRRHNVPNILIASFMKFSIAERARLKKENPDLRTVEIAMKLGQTWQNMSDEAKQPYIQAVIRERKRFEKKKRRTYRWHSMNLSEKEIKITFGEEGSSVSHARNCTINGT